MKNIKSIVLSPEFTAREALVQLNNAPEGYKTLFVTDAEGRLLATVTDGDIRRGLISGKEIDGGIDPFLFRDFRFLKKGNFSLEELDTLKEKNILLIPVLREDGKVDKIIDLVKKSTYLPIDAVIMAGGRGERLKPFTDTVPKPLLKVGGKPIIEYNIDRLISFGVDNINISIKYLGEQIKDHFHDGEEKGICISYITEDKPMGTIGAVGLCRNLSHEHLLVMNSDLLTNIDFADFYKFFLTQDADMAIATVPYKVNVPYAVLEVEEANIKSFKEKPVYTYYSNAGIYLIKKDLLRFIPEGKSFDATDLMECLIAGKRKVVSYPILEYWLDIGKHEDYKKAEEDIKHLKF